MATCSETAAENFTERFGDEAGDALRRQLDDLAARADEAVQLGTTGVIDTASMASRPSTEIATASRLVHEPELAGRTLYGSAHEGADYVDDLGRTFDAMGTPAASQYWKRPSSWPRSTHT